MIAQNENNSTLKIFQITVVKDIKLQEQRGVWRKLGSVCAKEFEEVISSLLSKLALPCFRYKHIHVSIIGKLME